MVNALAKKLQMKPGSKWLFLNAPAGYFNLLDPMPDGVTVFHEYRETFDGVQLFVKNSTELAAEFDRLASSLKPETIIWVIYPKKSSGIETDLEMMSGWEVAKKHKLRPVASAAIDKTWTTLRFRPEDLVKHSDARNSEIRNKNEFSDYIDVDTKTVKLPAEVMEALQHYPSALAYFEKLAYSHKKEYVVWVLSAKQDKTKAARIEKMVEMLSAGKKNPGDK